MQTQWQSYVEGLNAPRENKETIKGLKSCRKSSDRTVHCKWCKCNRYSLCGCAGAVKEREKTE